MLFGAFFQSRTSHTAAQKYLLLCGCQSGGQRRSGHCRSCCCCCCCCARRVRRPGACAAGVLRCWGCRACCRPSRRRNAGAGQQLRRQAGGDVPGVRPGQLPQVVTPRVLHLRQASFLVSGCTANIIAECVFGTLHHSKYERPCGSGAGSQAHGQVATLTV